MKRVIDQQKIDHIRQLTLPKPLTSSNGGLYKTANAGISAISPEIKNPLLSIENFFLPYSRKQLNLWVKYYALVHPIIANALDLHSTLPWARFELVGIEYAEVLAFYRDMADDLNLLSVYTQNTHNYFAYGEAFPFAHWDKSTLSFDYIEVIDPDFIEVLVNPMGGREKRFRRIIDEELKKAIDLGSENGFKSTIDQNNRVREGLYECAVEGGFIDIDEFYISHIQRGVGTDRRGVSLLLPCLKDLMYEDELRKVQTVTATRRLSPIEHWELGDLGEYGWLPSDAYVEQFQQMLTRLGNEVSPVLITAPGHKFNAYGIDDKFASLATEFERITRRLMIGLFTSISAVTGEGANFASAGIGLRYTQGRYDHISSMIMNWVEDKIFVPVAVANNFYTPIKNEITSKIRSKSILRKRQYARYIEPLLSVQEELSEELRTLYASNSESAINERNIKSATLAKVSRDLAQKFAMFRDELMLPTHQFRGRVNLLTDEGRETFLLNLFNRGIAPVKMLCDVFDVNYNELQGMLAKEQGLDADKVGDKIFDEKFQQNRGNPEEREQPLEVENIGLPEEPYNPETTIPGTATEKVLQKL